jgi:hypothetical protein
MPASALDLVQVTTTPRTAMVVNAVRSLRKMSRIWGGFPNRQSRFRRRDSGARELRAARGTNQSAIAHYALRFPFGEKAMHQPSGLIGPLTTLHAPAALPGSATNAAQSAHFFPSFGRSW